MDPDPDPANFVIDLQDANKFFFYFFLNFFCLLLFKGTFTPFLKIKCKKSHKAVGIEVFLNIFAW